MLKTPPPIDRNPKPAPSRRRRLLRLAGWLVAVVVISSLIPPLLSLLLKTDYPLAAITSGSMWPALRRGDLVIVSGVEPAAIAVGDIIVYQTDAVPLTIHRVIERRGDALVTKGDANTIADEPITEGAVKGRLLLIGGRPARIPKLGFISIIFNTLGGTFYGKK